MNNKGVVLVVFATWLTAALVVGATAGNKSASSKLVKDCVSSGGTQETCHDQVKSMSFRNKMLALQK